MKENKIIAKKLLADNPAIVFGFFLFAVTTFLTILPDLVLKMLINIISDKVGIKWIKLLKIFVDIPAAITTLIIITILFVAINYAVFRIVKELEIRKVFRMKVIGRFFMLILFDTAMFLLYNSLNILVMIFLKGYLFVSFLTDRHLPIASLVVIAIILIVSLVLCNLSFLARFGGLIYIYFMDLEGSLKNVFMVNTKLYDRHKKEIKKLLASFWPNLCWCILVLPIFYMVPYIQITMVLVVNTFIQEQEKEDFVEIEGKCE